MSDGDRSSAMEGEDMVEVFMRAHRQSRPDLDVAPMAVIGRVLRASRILDQRMRTLLATQDMEPWEFDVLASLRRSAPPHRLTAGALVKLMMLSPGALTNRVDRLVARRLVTRDVDPGNRRQVLIGLTDEGRELADRLTGLVAERHGELLAVLSAQDQEILASSLRTLLVSLGDRPTGQPETADADHRTDEHATA